MKRTESSNKSNNLLLPWLDVFAIGSWGILLVKYWLTDKLYLLIHPHYFWLVVTAGFVLIGISTLRALQLLRRLGKFSSAPVSPSGGHISLFPPGLGSLLLLVTAILGIAITPQVFASETALDRGVTDILSVTRPQPQAFRSATRPEDRSLIDWVRTLNVYPEPDDHTGEKVKVQGFVIHPPNLPDQYLLVARFVLTCCAADAYPVGLPVKLPQNRSAYPPDTWLEIEGQMITEMLANKRQLTIEASSLKQIPKPKNPYEY